MKFGKTFARLQIGDWARHYLHYKSLKQRIRNIRGQLKENEEIQNSVTEFVYTLDRELEKINSFYLYKKAEIDRRLSIYTERYRRPSSISTSGFLDEEPPELLSDIENNRQLLYALLQVREEAGHLERFAEQNRLAVHKILKKFDKKLGQNIRETYLRSKIALAPISTLEPLKDVRNTINSLIEHLEVDEQSSRATSPTQIDTKPQKKISLQETDSTALRQALREDDSTSVILLLQKVTKDRSNFTTAKFQQLFFSEACASRSLKVVRALVNFPVKLNDETNDLHQRNLLHRLLISSATSEFPNTAGRRPSVGGYKPINYDLLLSNDMKLNSPLGSSPSAPLPSNEQDDVIEAILGELEKYGRRDELRALLLTRDVLGRRPLHYSVLSNLPLTTRVLLTYVKKIPGVDCSNACNARDWADNEGYSPMLYCVLKGFDAVLRELLSVTQGLTQVDSFATLPEAKPPNLTSPTSFVSEPMSYGGLTFLIPHPQTLLSIACHYGHERIVEILLENGADISLTNMDVETPLHFACKYGHFGCLQRLLEKSECTPALIDTQDKYNKCTALHLAAMEGFDECVRLLLERGANIDLMDVTGCTAFEYAVLKSHNKVIELLKPKVKPYPIRPKLRKRESVKLPDAGTSGTETVSEAERVYGHKFLHEETLILIYFGTIDTRKPVNPVQLNPQLFSSLSSQPVSYSIVVSAHAAEGAPCIYDLPLSSSSVQPIPFYTKNLSEVMLFFDIQPTFGSRRDIIGRATTLLSSAKTSLYRERTSLGGSITVPIIASTSLDVLGTVTFEFTVVTPFQHINMQPGKRRMYWKSLTTQVIGHRGSGANRAVQGFSHLQLGENTVLSFVTAASLGAEYVEFDVQLTKDLIPILYHDWMLTESGYDIPVNAVTLQQFLDLHPENAPANMFSLISSGGGGNPNISDGSTNPSSAGRGERKKPSRSVSLGHMQWQQTLKNGDGRNVVYGGKGNSTGTIQAPFATLKSTFKQVPTHIGFNIEVKYPCIEEAETYDLHPAELNVYVDCILKCVYEHAGDRKIIFSSFNPEICLMLNAKQCNYPVFFLTEAGLLNFADMRCNSLHDAIKFAKSVNLLGIVTESTPLTLAPKLIPMVQETGLMLFSYGTRNNDVLNAQIQRNYGVDAVIVDSVAKVHRGLKEIEVGVSSLTVDQTQTSAIVADAKPAVLTNDITIKT